MWSRIVLAVFLAGASFSADVVVPNDVVIGSATRSVDLTTQLVKSMIEYSVQNRGKSEINSFIHLVSNAENERVAFIGATQQVRSCLRTRPDRKGRL